jgi:hypothetical protein
MLETVLAKHCILDNNTVSKQNGKFSDVSTEFLDMKYSNKQSAAVYNYIVKNFSYLTYAIRTFKPTKRKTKPYIFSIVYNTEPYTYLKPNTYTDF